jgi:hypothetical protein
MCIIQKLLPKVLLIVGLSTALLLTACGVSNNVSVTFTNGECAGGESNAPYCMAVQVQNNSSGQNWISSSNFPISNLGVSITGASNIQSPANTTSMDPNNCRGTTISPGGNCTFYLQLSQEAYPVESVESITLSINYTVNDTLFGSSSNNSSSQFILYEYTNLYAVESSTTNNGSALLWRYNNSGLANFGIVESGDAPVTLAIDNNSYGYLYLGGSLGVYTYNNESTSSSASISSGGIGTGASNLVTNGSTLYASGIGTNFGVWQYSFPGESWVSTTPIFTSGTVFANNISALSSSAVLYFTSQGIVYACNVASSTTACQIEGNGGGLSGSVRSLGFMLVSGGLSTGLYAATTTGLVLESGSTTSSANVWNQVTPIGNSESLSNITTLIASANASESGSASLYAGDTNGIIWVVNSTSPTTITQYSVGSGVGSAISAIVIDNIGQNLYFTAGTSIYVCSIASPNTSCTPTAIATIGSNPVVGLQIGSMLIGG